MKDPVITVPRTDLLRNDSHTVRSNRAELDIPEEDNYPADDESF